MRYRRLAARNISSEYRRQTRAPANNGTPSWRSICLIEGSLRGGELLRSRAGSAVYSQACCWTSLTFVDF